MLTTAKDKPVARACRKLATTFTRQAVKNPILTNYMHCAIDGPNCEADEA
jgi:hypothetical protein